MWDHLNQYDPDPEADEVIRRALNHLGNYVEMIIRPLNMRPRAASLIYLDPWRIEVRISTSTGHVILLIAPEHDLAGEIFWLKQLGARNLPVRQLISQDQTSAQVPFSYALVAFIGGAPLAAQPDEALIRLASRQVGRITRRMHQIPAPGFGRPTPTGRWPQTGWSEILWGWLDACGALQLAMDLLDEETYASMIAATIEHPDIACEQPRMIHGSLEPARILVTGSDGSIQLEALSRPGQIIAGDPLLDVATALLPTQPAAFRQGFLEGYVATGPLEPTQRLRLRRLGILALLADTVSHPNPEALALFPSLIAAELRTLAEALPTPL